MADTNKTSIKLVADVQDVQQKLDQVSKKLGEVGSAGAESAEKINQGYTSAARGVRSISEQLQSVQATIAKGAAIGAFTATISSMVSALSQAQQAGEKLKNSLEFSVGVSNISSELEYLRNVTRRLGLDYTSAADSYAKFSASVKGSGVSIEQTRTIFEGVAQATAKFGLSADDAKGVFLALSQMASKGVVSSEELRGQLAERLPGAMRIAAQAMGVTEREFSKMLETGQILASDFLPKFGQALKDGITAPMNSLTQEINRFNSAWDQWKQALSNADGGGFKWITDGLNESAAAMRELGKEAGITHKLLVAIGGFQAGAVGAGKFDTQQVQQDAMARLAVVSKGRSALEGKNLNYLEQESLRELIREETELRSQLMKLAEQRGIELFKLPDLKGEFEAQQAKRKEAFTSYMKDVQDEKAKQVDAENQKFSALTAVIGTTGKDYESALAAHQSKISEINKKSGSDGTKNDVAQIYAARLAEEKDYAKTAVEIIQEKVKQQVISERDGIEQTLAEQNAGFVRQAALMKDRLANTSDKGERQKILSQIVALGNDAAVASEKAASAVAHLDDASLKAYQNYMKGVGDVTSTILEKAKAAELENSQIGMTADQLAALTEKRYDEQIAIKEADAERLRGIDGRESELYLIEQQISALRRLQAADIAKPKLREQAREWEKFADDINRSLTDALMRGFESGKSFGQNFVDSLKASLKTIAIKLVVNMVTSAGGSLVASVADAALGTTFSRSSGSTTGSVLGAANNLSTAYSMYNNAGILAQWAGGSMSTANALGTVYANATGTGIDGLLATNGAYGTAAGGAEAGAGASAGAGSSAGVATVAWVAAIVAGMWMSSEAWKAGIRWENYAKQKDVALWDAEVGIRAAQDAPAKAIFGDGFVNSQWYAIMTGSSLSAQIHYAIQNALFGSKRQTGSQTAGTFSEADQGFSGQYGINMKKSGGLFSSSREWTDWFALPSQIDSVMDTLYRGVRNSFVMLGETFDDTSLAAKMQNFTYSFNIASTDMNSVVNAASSGLAEAIGNILTPSVSLLKKSGETWSSAFQRILLETNAVTRVTELMGKTMSGTFGQNNLDGVLKASDNFVTLFGSIENFNTAFTAYFSNFYTAQEQAAQGWRDIAKVFSSMDRTMPTTRQGFRDLVDSLDLNTEAGRSAFQTLMSVQGAFAALTPTLEDAAAAATAMVHASQEMQAAQIGAFYAAQRKAQQAAISAQMNEASIAAAAATSLIDSFRNISSSLGSYRDSLRAGTDTASSPMARYEAARAQYESTAAQARLGNVNAAGELQGFADAFLQAARDVGTSSSYSADVAGVIATVDAVVGVADRQIPIAESQLSVANQQLGVLQAMLDQMSGSQVPAVVANYQQAATDWAQFFAGTAIGASVQTAAGTMQRISQSMGLLIDGSGNGYTFSANDNPYTLASVSSSFRQYMIDKYGSWNGPSFASGGFHSGGLRLVGENGPELEFTGPSAIIDAGQTSSILANAGGMADVMGGLLREISELRSEVRSGQAALIQNTAKTARTLDRFDIDGMPETRAA